MPDTLTLAALDGESVTISLQVAKKSQLLKDLMEDLDEEELQFPVPIQADGATLKLVAQWCELQIRQEQEAADKAAEVAASQEIQKEEGDEEHEKKGSGPCPQPYRARELPTWAKGFFENLSQDETFALITTANFLDIQLLIEQTATFIAGKIKGMSTEQMREYFNIENDFTPEEEERIRRENEWAMPRNWNH
ncbi:E3 ubiquitin ligase SCF complex, Skp subunit [Hypoxylon sp. FL0543]|nr:E3 ubiquitin ligase SCF complex, Skp subunit [Hypoxylon sp. FL0543]